MSESRARIRGADRRLRAGTSSPIRALLAGRPPGQIAGRVLAILLAAAPAAAADFVVNSRADRSDAWLNGTCDDGSGVCTLRAAIEEANFELGNDNILFNIPGAPPWTIVLGSALPPLNDHGGLGIDGASQPGYTGTPVVELDGGWVGGSCLRSMQGHLYLRGLSIFGCAEHAVFFDGSHLNAVTHSWLGLDSQGNARFNGGHGVAAINSSQNTIEDCVLSANGGAGIYLSTSRNVALDNRIGTDPAGGRAIPNDQGGVRLEGATDSVIGGAGGGNWIAGNAGPGIWLGAASCRNRILGNFIGTSERGALAAGNGLGIVIEDGCDNEIGGDPAVEGNEIAGNLGTGIKVLAGEGNLILGNRIHANAELGIDLGGDGIPDLNDPGDADSGPNTLLNRPVLDSAVTDCTTLTLSGSFEGAPGLLVEIEVFCNAACDVAGSGEGHRPLGRFVVATDASGRAAFAAQTLAFVVPAGTVITTTASDFDGNTSELSACVTVTGPACAGSCGNGRLDPCGEDCDGGGVPTPTCDLDCSFPSCGDGLQNAAAGEECDDGNRIDDDGCSGQCQLEACAAPDLAEVAALLAVRSGPAGITFSWSAVADATRYHINTLDLASDIASPWLQPRGRATLACSSAAPALSCQDDDALATGPGLGFYQALAACGDAPDDEAPR